MNCEKCGRELREDSKFCDYCGNFINKEENIKTQSRLNIRLLIGGILFSVLLTLFISGIIHSLGVPLFFGGLFLPFFWQKFKKK